ncbi:hypothetical protein ACFV0T_20135 [Streptomyces sp. NPDC059582]|uniref:hypothetical protein n=1 Tax=Streptomyces sp. NPDC059582 TaxID=3346875 RepID=UPI0036CA2ECB
MVDSVGSAPGRFRFAQVTPPAHTALAAQAESATSPRTMHTHVQIGTSPRGRSHVR